MRIPAFDQRPDPEIARDAVNALNDHLPFSHQGMKVTVQDGWITLEGEAEWNYQKERVESAVRWIKGVKGVINSIQLKPKVTSTEIKSKIEEAFRRNAELDANNI